MTLNDMSALQTQTIIRHFTQFSNYFAGLQKFVINEIQNVEATNISDLIQKQIKKLHFDENFLGIMLKIGRVTDQIAYFRQN